jgi:iron-sulfur cluster assembly protein
MQLSYKTYMSIINVCSKTVTHFRNLLKSTNHTYILLSVRGSGCNGLKYDVSTSSDDVLKSDETVNVDGVPVVIYGQSLMYLIGTNIEWKTDTMGAGIGFSNPNAKSSCGCGDTFSVK